MMNQQNPQEIPVYLFFGFLDSGKTKFIQETLEDERFNAGERTLLLLCEEGEVELKPEVRDMCAGGSCQQYAKRWSCPPGCGTLEECNAQVNQYSYGILVQTVGDIEDSFDFEAMMEIQQTHKAHFDQMHKSICDQGEQVLALGAGCCTRCKECTYPDAPCRFPDRMVLCIGTTPHR